MGPAASETAARSAALLLAPWRRSDVVLSPEMHASQMSGSMAPDWARGQDLGRFVDHARMWRL